MTLRSKKMSPRFARLLAAPIAVLALVAGAAAAAPAASASITPACVWQSLYLLDGWQSAQSDWNTGDPAYCVDDGVVYLSGSLKNPANGNAEFAVLPPQALPTSNLFLDVYTYGGTVGQLTIDSDGAMSATGGSAGKYTSLAGISFPVAGAKLSPMLLLEGWVSAQNLYGTGDPSYADINHIIYWTGSIRNPLDTGNTWDWGFDAAPPPDRCMDTFVYTYDGNVGELENWPPSLPNQDKPQSVYETTVGTTWHTLFTSLAGISYPESGQAAWQPLALQPGWSADNPYPPYCTSGDTPSYWVQDHVVYLSGEVAQNGTGGFFATLPAAARPQHDLWLMTLGGYLHISPNGNMYSSSGSISLGNISYQASS